MKSNKLLMMAATLSMLSLPACGQIPEIAAIPVAPDTAPADSCPREYVIAPTLQPLEKFLLPDGRAAYLADIVTANNKKTARFVVKARDSWALCVSAVIYLSDALKPATDQPSDPAR